MRSTTSLHRMPADTLELEERLSSLEARLSQIETELLAAPSCRQPLSPAGLAAIEQAIAEHCH